MSFLDNGLPQLDRTVSVANHDKVRTRGDQIARNLAAFLRREGGDVTRARPIALAAIKTRPRAPYTYDRLIKTRAGKDSMVDGIAVGNTLIVAPAGNDGGGDAPIEIGLAILKTPVRLAVDQTGQNVLAAGVDHLGTIRNFDIACGTDRTDPVALDDHH